MIKILCFEIVISFLASLTMAYTSMSISVGPWISPAIILICNLLFFKFRIIHTEKNQKAQTLSLLQISPSLAGLVSVAIGFTLPTLYFLNKNIFLGMVEKPQLFLAMLATTTLFSCLWGFFIANLFLTSLTDSEDLEFPIPKLFLQIISELGQKVETFFFKGFLTSIGSLGLMDFMRGLQMVSTSSILYPSMISIGFAMGYKIIKALAFGFALKLFVIPKYSTALCLQKSNQESMFLIAASIICLELLISTITYAWQKSKSFMKKASSGITIEKPSLKITLNANIIPLAILSLLALFVSKINGVALPITIFVLAASLFTTYEIMKFAASTGLAPFGRFSTFVMIPTMLLFSTTDVSLVNICLFISISGACAVNFLFNSKMAQLQKIDLKNILWREIWAIILTSILSSIVFWIFFKYLEVGSVQLFAQRGQSRAMLIKANSIDFSDFIFGAACLIFIKIFKLSEMLVISSLLMPFQLSISMMLGACLAKVIKKEPSSEFFFAGVFSGESIYILCRLFLGTIF